MGRPRGGGGPRRRRPGTPACRAAGCLPEGRRAAYLRSLPRCPSAGRLWASLGYFLKRTQDRQESWFLNNFLRARPPPVPQRFLLPLPDSWSQRRSLRLSLPRRPAVTPALPPCAPSPRSCFSPPPPTICRPLPGHWERRALRAGQTAPRPLGQRVGAKGLPTQGDSFALQNFKLGWPGGGVWSQTAVATQHV